MRLLLLLPLLTACTSSKDTSTPDDTAETGETGQDTADSGSGDTQDTEAVDPLMLVLDDAKAMRWTVELDVAVVEVQQGGALVLDWSDVTTDLWGAPLDPASLNFGEMLELPDHSPEEIEKLVTTGAFLQEDIGYDLVFQTGDRTWIDITQMFPVGSATHPEDAWNLSHDPWLVSVGRSQDPASSLLLILVPVDDAGAPSVVELVDHPSTAAISGLEAPTLAVVPAETHGADWTGVTQGSDAGPFDLWAISGLSIFEFTEPAEEVAARWPTDWPRDTSDFWNGVVTSNGRVDDWTGMYGAGPFQGMVSGRTYVFTLSAAMNRLGVPRYAAVVSAE